VLKDVSGRTQMCVIRRCEMELLVVDGVYEDGKVTLKECPAGVRRSQVRVTFVGESDAIEEEVSRRREAGKRLLASMREGIDFGGEKFNREEIYEERLRELEQRRGR